MTHGNLDAPANGPDDDAPAPSEKPLFVATLVPYRSLNAAGFLWLMGVVGLISFVAGVFFASHGAWPVMGFFGLDALGIYLAFRFSYRSALAVEEIDMTRERLLVRKIAASGAAREYRFNPYWARLEVDRRPEGVLHIAIAHRQQRLPIATFLNPDDRESFAKAFAAALATARTTPAF